MIYEQGIAAAKCCHGHQQEPPKYIAEENHNVYRK
ncbi:hypothetical protein T4B_5695, partial [Trichinella pseudospiralis]